MKFTDSNLIANYIAESKTMGLLLNPENVKHVVETTCSATADFLKMVKTKTEPVALTYEDLKGNILVSAIIAYEENEDDKEAQGNWVYYWSFDPKDVEGAKTYSISSPQIHTIFSKRAAEDYRMFYTSTSFVSSLAVKFIGMLSDFLDQNAKEGTVFKLEHEGYFTASVEIDNGEKIKSFIPSGEMKRLIKDDDATEPTA